MTEFSITVPINLRLILLTSTVSDSHFSAMNNGNSNFRWFSPEIK